MSEFNFEGLKTLGNTLAGEALTGECVRCTRAIAPGEVHCGDFPWC